MPERDDEIMAAPLKLLNLGCGSRFHRDWINIDFCSSSPYVKTHNLLAGIPYQDNFFDVVYHNNVLEHFLKDAGEKLIGECFRVLKFGGILRVVVPDLENIVRCYLDQLEKALAGDREAESNYDWIMLEMYDQAVRNYSGGFMAEYLRKSELENESFINQRCGTVVRDIRQSYLAGKPDKSVSLINKCKNLMKRAVKRMLGETYALIRFRQCGEVHQWMYDRFSLQRLLLNNGFSQVEIKSPYDSTIPDWHLYELDVKNDSVHAPMSLYMEAIKL